MLSKNAEAVLLAFVEAYDGRTEHVTFRRRGGGRGYVTVVPSGFEPEIPDDRHVTVEAEGSVSVTKALRDALNDARIRHRRKGMAPGLGRFTYGISFEDATNWEGGLAGFVRKVKRCYATLRTQIAHVSTMNAVGLATSEAWARRRRG